jgi:hypothetical protein
MEIKEKLLRLEGAAIQPKLGFADKPAALLK